MNRAASIVRYIFFCIFFAAGASAIALSILADEIVQNYRGIEQLKLTEEDTARLEELLKAYDLQLDQVKNNPEVLERIRRKILGDQEQDGDITHPIATLEELQFAKEALKASSGSDEKHGFLRTYAERATKKHVKEGLFLSGSGLILIALTFFGAPKIKKRKQCSKVTGAGDAE